MTASSPHPQEHKCSFSRTHASAQFYRWFNGSFHLVFFKWEPVYFSSICFWKIYIKRLLFQFLKKTSSVCLLFSIRWETNSSSSSSNELLSASHMVAYVCADQRITGIELVNSSLGVSLPTSLCNSNKFKDSWTLSCHRDHLVSPTFLLLQIGKKGQRTTYPVLKDLKAGTQETWVLLPICQKHFKISFVLEPFHFQMRKFKERNGNINPSGRSSPSLPFKVGNLSFHKIVCVCK